MHARRKEHYCHAFNNALNLFQMFFIKAAFDNLWLLAEKAMIPYLSNNVSIYLNEEMPKTFDNKGQRVFSSFNKYYHNRLESINNSTGSWFI